MTNNSRRPAPGPLIEFVLREWLLAAAGAGYLLTGLYSGRFSFVSQAEAEVLFILFALLVAVSGLENSGLLQALARRLERGRAPALKLVALTFFLALLVTNDVALVIVVPLTLAFGFPRLEWMIILEALAANAGSALTPFGNPQNLFLYWFYGLGPAEFVRCIAPFSLLFLFLLLPLARLAGRRPKKSPPRNAGGLKNRKAAFIYGLLLGLLVLVVLRLVPLAAGALVIFYALIFDRRTLRVDYALLLTFFFFFGLADNLQVMLAARLSHSGHIFLFSALASQVISNVPAALLFAKFTTNWQALLWGVNAGGFGSLFGSLANLIAYRLYLASGRSSRPAVFTLKFLACGYVAFFLAIGLYFLPAW